jgi:hypothetical protein
VFFITLLISIEPTGPEAAQQRNCKSSRLDEAVEGGSPSVGFLTVFLLYPMDDAGSYPVCEGAMFSFTKASSALLTIPSGFAFAPKDRFAYPAVRPFPALDLFFVGLLWHMVGSQTVRCWQFALDGLLSKFSHGFFHNPHCGLGHALAGRMATPVRMPNVNREVGRHVAWTVGV